jgi:hypothetical protein
MKFIGQFIQSFIARFRNDVYLEAVESGTIASGGNLGLDSNNKIVKADTESSDLSITNASNNRVVTSTGGTGLNAESSIIHTNFETQFNNSVGDFFGIAIGDNGATTLSTVDDASTGDGTSADLLVDIDGDITLDSHTGAHYIKNNGTTFATFQNDIFRLESSVSSSPEVQLFNSNTDANAPGLSFVKSATGADDDTLGRISFIGDNESDAQHFYALIEGSIKDATANQESGMLEFKVADHDNTMTTGIKLDGDANDGAVDVTIGGGTSSTTSILGGISMGAADGTNSEIKKLPHDDGVGGDLLIKAGGATAGNGVNDQAGGNLQMYAGGSTGNSFGGAIEFYSSTRTGGGNDTANNVGKICEISPETSASLLSLYSYDGSNYVTTDNLSILVSPSGSTQVSTTDSDGHEGDFSVVADGEINLQAYEGDNINFKITPTSGGTQTIGTLQKGRFQLQGVSGSASMIELFEDTANGTNGVRLQAADNMASSRVIALPDAGGTVLLKDNVNPGKQFQVFQCNFIDDLNTSEVFIPIHGTTFEGAQVYQDDVAILAPCDGRIVSLDFKCISLTNNGDLTVKIYTLPPNTVGTSGGGTATTNWTEEESETISVTSTDDNHVFHFAFDNAKHFESTEMFALSIQASADVMSQTFMYATVVVEFDYSTLLPATSAEFDSVP